MKRITESEYSAALAVCRDYIAQCQNDIANMDIRASRFKGIAHLGLTTRTQRGLQLFVNRRSRQMGIKSDTLSPYEEFTVLCGITKKDFIDFYGVGAKGDKEIIRKLSEYGIEIK